MRGLLTRLIRHRWLITGCLAAGILVLSLLPNPPKLDIGVSYTDKIGHFAAYLVLAFMLLLSLAWKSGLGPASRASRRKAVAPAAAAAVGIATGYGALIEVLQHFTGRQTELLDVIADLAGALAGVLLFFLVAVPVARRRGVRQQDAEP